MDKSDAGIRLIRPTLFVGVGGTGQEIVSRLKKYVRENFTRDVPIRFLTLDCDAIPLERLGLESTEAVELGEGLDGNGIVRNLKAHPAIASWWTSGFFPGRISDGARQMRSIGRMAFFARYHERIRPRLEAILTDLLRTRGDDEIAAMERERVSLKAGAVSIQIVGSICGGTGAGIFLDTAFLLREFFRARTNAEVRVTGTFVLARPYERKMTIPEMIQKIRANTYASLKEIDRFDEQAGYRELQLQYHSMETPFQPSAEAFDYVYLVDSQNTRNQFLQDLPDVWDLVATKLSLESSFDQVRTSMESNIEPYKRDRIPEGGRKGRQRYYNGLACAALVFPARRIVRHCVLRKAVELLDAWKQLAPSGKNVAVERHVTEFKSRARLEEHDTDQVLDRLRIDENGARLRDSIPLPNLGDWTKAEGVAKTAMQRLDARIDEAAAAVKRRAEEVREQAKEAIRNEIQGLMRSGSGQGPDYAISFALTLQASFRYLAKELKDELDRFKPAWRRRRAEELLEEMQEHLSAFFKRKRELKVENAFRDWQVAAKRWIDGAVERKAREEAIAIYQDLTAFVREEEKRFTRTWHRTEELQATLRDLEARMRFTQKAREADRFVLVEEVAVGGDALERLYAEFAAGVTVDSQADLLADAARWLAEDDLSAVERKLTDRLAPAFDGILKMNVFDAAKRFEGKDPAQIVAHLLDEARPFLSFDEAACGASPPRELVFIGVDDSRLERYAGLREQYKEPTYGWVSTNDPTQVLISATAYCMPAFALPLLREYKYAYEQVMTKAQQSMEAGDAPWGFCHLHKDWGGSLDFLPDLFPE